MAEQGTKLVSGNKLVEAAKTAEALCTPQEFTEKLETLKAGITGSKSVIVQALASNAAAVVVGGPDVVAEVGAKGAAPKRKGIVLAANESIAIDIDDPSKVWVDAITSKEGVLWLAMVA